MRIYAYYVENHDGNFAEDCSIEEGVRYTYWYADGMYATLEEAQERLRMDYEYYRNRTGAKQDQFYWKPTIYKDRRVWQCYDKYNPYGWKIVEWTINDNKED